MAGSVRLLAAHTAAGGVANIAKIGIQLIMLPLMAHLLGPHEYGLYALTLPAVVFFTSLADGGLGTSLAREGDQSSPVWSTAFWLLLAVGLALSGAVAAWGVALSRLSNEPQALGLMAFMSLSLPLITSSVLPSARLLRQGRLAMMAGADLAAASVGAALAIGLALEGAGAWSLSSQYVGGFLIRMVILNAVAFVPPYAVFDLASLRPHLATGSSLISGRLAEFAGRLVENLVIGRVFGAALLGQYAFANQSSRFICEAASGPTWGALYAVALHGQPVRTATAYRQISAVLCIALFPTAALIVASAPALLPLLLGDKWAAAAPFIQVIIPTTAMAVIAMQCTAPLLAAGESWLPFWFSAATALLRITAVSAGALVSPAATASGIAVVNLLISASVLIAARRRLGPGFRLPASVFRAPLISSVFGGLACFALLRLPLAAFPVVIVAALAAGAGTYILSFALMDRARLANGWRHARNLAR